MSVPWGALADVVLSGHLLFVLFVVGGGLLVLRWRRVAWVHLPCAAWGAVVELTGWVCPLTPLEGALRRRAGEAAYTGSFLQHYVGEVLYPVNLTRSVQVALGVGVVLLNACVYGWVLWRRERR